jgi:hypothetical protein
MLLRPHLLLSVPKLWTIDTQEQIVKSEELMLHR